MDTNMQTLLDRIQEARFVCIDLQEYLDTHPDDESAQADFYTYAEKLNQLIDLYERQYGPLLNFGSSATMEGSWVFQKWPWDL